MSTLFEKLMQRSDDSMKMAIEFIELGKTDKALRAASISGYFEALASIEKDRERLTQL